jgi:hypothetical protein
MEKALSGLQTLVVAENDGGQKTGWMVHGYSG